MNAGIIFYRKMTQFFRPNFKINTILKINLIFVVSVIKRGFEGINRAQHKSACNILPWRPWYIFKPLPIDHGSLVLLLSIIQEMKSSENGSSSSQYSPSSLQYPSTSSQQVLLNSLPFQDLPSSSRSQKLTYKKEKTVLQNIYIGTARKKVSAVPCKFGDFTIYLVVAKDINFLLFFKKNEKSSVEPLGFIAKFVEFQRVWDSFFSIAEKFTKLFSEEMTCKYKSIY